MGIPNRLLHLRRVVESQKDHWQTIVVDLDLLDLLLRGELPVGENELPPEEVTKQLYEVKSERDKLLRFAEETRRECGEYQIPANMASEVKRLKQDHLQQRGVINILADRLARWTGTTASDEIRKAREACIEEQADANLAAVLCERCDRPLEAGQPCPDCSPRGVTVNAP